MTTNPLRVLLADDDDDDCFFFNQILTSLPVATALTVVRDGEQLMDLLQQEGNTLPDIVFLDLNMPRLSGYECLVELKRDPQLIHLPVIILSTFILPELQERLYSLGAMRCVQKPTDFNQLRVLIGEVIARFVAATDAPIRGEAGKISGGTVGKS
jgi:CheY-like chemotaxis protein